MYVKINNQRKSFNSEVHDIYTKETEQGLVSTFLVNDKEKRFLWVDFEQCKLICKEEFKGLSTWGYNEFW